MEGGEIRERAIKREGKRKKVKITGGNQA